MDRKRQVWYLFVLSQSCELLKSSDLTFLLVVENGSKSSQIESIHPQKQFGLKSVRCRIDTIAVSINLCSQNSRLFNAAFSVWIGVSGSPKPKEDFIQFRYPNLKRKAN
ncbi:hypothetical protein CEXT_551531 [Caerostris extrusa]|uniref:Uncharacterized protein n=1 Tax=Caerostris extrusa TaxID=172846 RepID=A0AAV4SW15_CAEEX|nr:hypothetical protein CEXT_551531 [Caerostris extrusa]